MTSGLLTKNLNDVAYLSNAIVRSPLNFSGTEARVFALALGCLHQKRDSLDFQIHFDDILPSGGGRSYTLLDEALQRLSQPLLTYAKKNKTRSNTRIPLFSIIRLDEGTKLIVGQFNNVLREFLLVLSGQFTTVELESLLKLKSAHSHRLFWILKSYVHQDKPEAIPFETLREWLFGENSETYAVWSDFNRYVLKPAFVEFERIGWVANVEVKRRGHGVSALLFTMSNNTPVTSEELATSKKALTRVQIGEFRAQLHARYDKLPALYDRLCKDYEFKEYQAREVVLHLNDHASFERILRVLAEVDRDLESGVTIKSVVAYALGKIKAVLPVYQLLPAGGMLDEGQLKVIQPKVSLTQKRAMQKMESELDDLNTSLRFVRDEAPEALYSPEERAVKVQEITDQMGRIREKLGRA